MELSSSTLYLVRIAQTTGEHLRRGEGDCVEGATPAAQAIYETGCSRQAPNQFDHILADARNKPVVRGAAAIRLASSGYKRKAFAYEMLRKSASLNAGGDHKMLRAVLIAKPEVLLTWS
jgi:hypothetical protein